MLPIYGQSTWCHCVKTSYADAPCLPGPSPGMGSLSISEQLADQLRTDLLPGPARASGVEYCVPGIWGGLPRCMQQPES